MNGFFIKFFIGFAVGLIFSAAIFSISALVFLV